MKRTSNLLFIFFFTLTMMAIGFLNYFVDPYNLTFDRPNEINLYNYPNDLFSIVLKKSTKSKYRTLTFGASTTSSFINIDFLTDNYAMLASGYMNQDTLKNYVEFFIANHSELEMVIFNVEYASYYFDRKNIFPVIKNSKLTISEIVRLFFSIDTTILSIKSLVNNSTEIFDRKRYENRKLYSKPNNEIPLFENTINISPYLVEDKEYNVFIKRNNNHHMKALKKETFQYLEEYINLFQKYNMKVIYIFPPYHALLQSKIYKDFNYEDIENMKRLIVNSTNAKVLDFAYINKYTTENLNDTYLYIDLIHPYSYKYNSFYCALNNIDQYQKSNIYIELTKSNIEKVLFEQRKLLENYVTKNKKSIDIFMSYYMNNFAIKKSTKNAPICSIY